MPRKRARNPLKRQKVDHDLAPSDFVNKNKRKKSTKNDGGDDNGSGGEEEEGGRAPRAWRLMMQQKEKHDNKHKVSKKDTKKQDKRGRSKEQQSNELKIQPGEKMSEFSQRVNAALPLIKTRSGSPSRAEKKKRKQRARAERLAEQHKKQKRGDDGEDIEDEEDEMEQVFNTKRDTSPDPWAALEAKRNDPKFNEVVDKPPELKITKRMMGNVPKAAGSMARRAMLEEERARVIEAYRQNSKNSG